jgi:hypothetical protein
VVELGSFLVIGALSPIVAATQTMLIEIKEEAIVEVFPVDPPPKSIGTSCNTRRCSNLCPTQFY